MLLTLKVSQRSLKLIFHLISLDRCKIWGSVGTKVWEKALGADESACLRAKASKGVTAKTYWTREDRRSDWVLLRVRAHVLWTPQEVKAVFDFDK